MSVILAFMLLLASNEIFWSWDVSQGADSYLILQAAQGENFEVVHVVDGDMSPPWWFDCSPGRVCTQFTAWPSAPGQVLFIVVLACNNAGCSPTEHGSFAGEGYFP